MTTNLVFLTLLIASAAGSIFAAEQSVTSPDGKLKLIVSDERGLRYRVEVDGQALLNSSRLGLEFADGVSFGPAAKIGNAKTSSHDGTWENRFGKCRTVRDCWNQAELTMEDSGHSFGVIVRAYDDGVAFPDKNEVMGLCNERGDCAGGFSQADSQPHSARNDQSGSV